MIRRALLLALAASLLAGCNTVAGALCRANGAIHHTNDCD